MAAILDLALEAFPPWVIGISLLQQLLLQVVGLGDQEEGLVIIRWVTMAR